MKKLDNINSLNKKNEAFYDRLSNVKGFITPTKSMVKKYHTQSKYRKLASSYKEAPSFAEMKKTNKFD